MHQPAQKYTYYFRRNDETDQKLYRLLMRHPAAPRTELFRDMVRSGFRLYLRRRRTKKRQPNGPAPEIRVAGPTTSTRRLIDEAQPWK
jgi:hypothetical protein